MAGKPTAEPIDVTKALVRTIPTEQIADRETLLRLSRFLPAEVALTTESILLEWDDKQILVATVHPNPWTLQRLAQALHTVPTRITLKPLRKERFEILYEAIYKQSQAEGRADLAATPNTPPHNPSADFAELEWTRIDQQPHAQRERTANAQKNQRRREQARIEVERERGLGLTIREIITEAVLRAASDVHFEPHPDGGLILVRRHGRLETLVSGIPEERYQALVHALAERAGRSASDVALRPTDAVLNFVFHHRQTDEYRRMTIRFASVPDIRGPAITLRIQGERVLDFEEIGFEREQLQIIDQACRYRQGVLLVTGPTGSGKSVTLEAIKRELARRNPDLKFCETGDPIEFPSPRRVQVEVRSRDEAKTAFRTFLRMDPDIICQGEVRDAEMAALLFEAANTGHLVLSTLHTNDAASTFNRLLDFGLPRYEIADVLRLIIAQRLVPRLCAGCAAPLDDDEAAAWINSVAEQTWPEQRLQAVQALSVAARRGLLRKRLGCDRCRRSGTGRLAVTETLLVDADMVEEFKSGVAATHLVARAVARGRFIPFSRVAVGKVLSGQIAADAIYDLVLQSAPLLVAAQNLGAKETDQAKDFVDRAAQRTQPPKQDSPPEQDSHNWIDAEWELVEEPPAAAQQNVGEQSGWSLLELLIVIALIVIIAAFALPRLWQTKQASTEQIVRTRLVEIAAQQAVFRNLLGRARYATLSELQNTQAEGRPLVSAIDLSVQGWSFFDAEPPSANTFCLGARRATDSLSFAVAEDGRVRRCQPPQYTTASRLCPPAN